MNLFTRILIACAAKTPSVPDAPAPYTGSLPEGETLELGGHYLSRGGNICGPLTDGSEALYPFRSKGESWRADGRAYSHIRTHPSDLVKRVRVHAVITPPRYRVRVVLPDRDHSERFDDKEQACAHAGYLAKVVIKGAFNPISVSGKFPVVFVNPTLIQRVEVEEIPAVTTWALDEETK